MGIGRVISVSGSIPTAAVLSGVYLYSRLLARTGQAVAETGESTMRSSVASSRLARRAMRFRMRDGARVRCRIVDAGGLLSVNVDRDYDIPGTDWESLSSIVDIGAHVGTFTIWAALRSPLARILAVEPNPETFAFLKRNIRDNGLDGRVVAINAAVGPSPGVGSLEHVEHSLGTRLAPAGKTKFAVRVETIRSLLEAADINDVDLLKIDCEGMEYDVFASLDRAYLERMKTIACEYHPQPGHDVTQLDAMLEAAGFKVHRSEAPLGVLWALHSPN